LWKAREDISSSPAMPGGLMIPGRNMPAAAAMIGGLAGYAASLGQVL